MSNDLGERALSQHTDKLIPVYTDGTPITWEDDNDAHILGNLYEVGRYFKRSHRPLPDILSSPCCCTS